MRDVHLANSGGRFISREAPRKNAYSGWNIRGSFRAARSALVCIAPASPRAFSISGRRSASRRRSCWRDIGNFPRCNSPVISRAWSALSQIVGSLPHRAPAIRIGAPDWEPSAAGCRSLSGDLGRFALAGICCYPSAYLAWNGSLAAKTADWQRKSDWRDSECVRRAVGRWLKIWQEASGPCGKAILG
jgi:hypothetical protein